MRISNKYLNRTSLLPESTSWSTRMPGIGISGWYTVLRQRGLSIFGGHALVSRSAVILRQRSSRCSIFQARMTALQFGAIVTADLDHALEVNVHTVGEFEGLEISETNDGSTRPEVLHFMEPLNQNNNDVIDVFVVTYKSRSDIEARRG